MEMQQYFNLDETAWREFGGITKGVFVKALSTRAFTESLASHCSRWNQREGFPNTSTRTHMSSIFYEAKEYAGLAPKAFRSSPVM